MTFNDIPRKLPAGIQSFEKIREEKYIYVDKTGFIYRLVKQSVPFFLSRPRRFGKSLLLSTMAAYWEGKKELFKGLEIERLEENNPEAWRSYPVLYFDMNGQDYTKKGALENTLSAHLKLWEQQYGGDPNEESLATRFKNLLIAAHNKTGSRCVVLIDEYDKPLLDVIGNSELQEHNKALFKGFFSNLKSCDAHIKYIFITGVTKFHKVSIFSDLNQLVDISLNEDFSALCGITEEELKENFRQEIEALSARQGMTRDECLSELKKTYDGYRFNENGVNVYNPFNLLNSLFAKAFGSYWFESGTPTFLVKTLRESKFDVRRFTNRTIYASDSVLQDYTGDSLSPTPMLYQTGYLTIADYNKRLKRYTLCFPNEEVKYGLLNSMMPSYVHNATEANGLDIFTLEEHIENGELDEIRNILTALFARITYTTKDDPFEHYFQTVIYLVFTLLGKFVECEMHTFAGRIDCRVETDKYVYLFEFKRDETAEAALKQIEDKSYTLPFVADQRKLFKIGVSFDSEKRILADWEAVEG